MSNMDGGCIECKVVDSEKCQEATAGDPSITEATSLLHQKVQHAESSIAEHRKEIKRLQYQNQQLLKKEHDALKDAEHWRAKYDAKAADLTEAKNALFDAQGPNQISDSQIARQWNELCVHIEQWVDDHIQLDCKHFNDQVKQFFESKIVYKAMKDRIPDYWNESRKEATKQCNDRFELLVCLSIHTTLGRWVFSEDLPMIGIPAPTAVIVYQIEEMMRTLTTSKDGTKRAQWRSDALEALCASPDYIKSRRETIAHIVSEAKDTLGHLLLKDQDEALRRFAQDIVEPAISLDRILRQSTTDYFFLSKICSRPHPDRTGQLLCLDCFRMASAIDIETGKKVTLKDEIRTSDLSPIGQKVLVVFPALFFERGQTFSMLTKQLLLAQMDVPRVRRKLKAASLATGDAE